MVQSSINACRVFAINGSPRKNHNTGLLLKSFLEGAQAADHRVEIKLVNLYDLKYSGCRECYKCKLKEGGSIGHCSYPDDLHYVFKDMSSADIISFGTPIFFGDITGELHCFLERLIYPLIQYSSEDVLISKIKNIETAFICTMNVDQAKLEASESLPNLKNVSMWLEKIYGKSPAQLFCYDTLQHRNYDLYVPDSWNIEEKKKRHREQFPIDCQNAYDLGWEMANRVLSNLIR